LPFYEEHITSRLSIVRKRTAVASIDVSRPAQSRTIVYAAQSALLDFVESRFAYVRVFIYVSV